MTKVGIIRCEINESFCPLTSGLRCAEQGTEGFQYYENAQVVGIFTCHCPGNNVGELAKILKSKGAEAIHISTCMFASKNGSGWTLVGGGFCEKCDALMETMHQATGLPCIKGTAHLPNGFTPSIPYT